MEKGGQRPSDAPSKMAGEERSCISEKREVIMAVTKMLESGTLDEKSSQLLEQLADCIRRPPTEAAAQQTAPPSGEPMEAEPSEEPVVELNSGGDSKSPAEKKAFVGSLRTTTEDRWTCKVPSCTGGFHRLRDCKLFHKMEAEDRIKLVDHHDLCLGCLTPGHGRAARSCPYEEERADACLFFFCLFFWRARVCRPLLRLCRPFMIFEGCLDSNPEYCCSKLARYRLSHPSL
jgi:hypothetical protein